jgi:hypothetical protein
MENEKLEIQGNGVREVSREAGKTMRDLENKSGRLNFTVKTVGSSDW